MNSLIEIPANLPRFVVLPKIGKTQLVMYLDDIIRFALDQVFSNFPYDQYESYAIKFTRDAELEFDDDFTESYYEKLADSLKAREEGPPVRANFDHTFPKPFLNLVLRKLNVAGSDSLYPGARYHNRRDLLQFPQFGRKDLEYAKAKQVRVKGIKEGKLSFFQTIRKRDLLLHFPYQPFRILIALLQEAAIDPLVQSIRVTQYRLAKDSSIAKALQAAARNGKDVFVLVEPQARFDEEANMTWASRYRSAGVRVQLGVSGLKVHSKMVLITRRESSRLKHYSALGTGNFNEDTARLFADHLLLTYDQEIGDDISEIFRFFEQPYRPPQLKHLVAAPFSLREFLREKVALEVENHKAGLPAKIAIKVNNFSDIEMTDLLEDAAGAGVEIRLIVRSMFSMVVEEDSPIEAISLVDKYLEHSRCFIFENGGSPLYFLTSADLMPRNLDSRVETAFPIYDRKLRKQLKGYFDIQWSDNVKARILDRNLSNRYRERGEVEEEIRSQFAIPEFLESAQ